MSNKITPKQSSAIIELIDQFSQEGIPNVRFSAALRNDCVVSSLRNYVGFSIIVRGIVRQTYWISPRGTISLQFSEYINTCFVRSDHKWD